MFMIKIYVTLNEGQDAYNEHMMYSRVWGSHRAKPNDEINSARGIVCEVQTHLHTYT